MTFQSSQFLLFGLRVNEIPNKTFILDSSVLADLELSFHSSFLN